MSYEFLSGKEHFNQQVEIGFQEVYDLESVEFRMPSFLFEYCGDYFLPALGKPFGGEQP